MRCGNTNDNYFFKKSLVALYLEPGLGGHGQSCAMWTGDSRSPSGTDSGVGMFWVARVGCLALSKHFLSWEQRCRGVGS